MITTSQTGFSSQRPCMAFTLESSPGTQWLVEGPPSPVQVRPHGFREAYFRRGCEDNDYSLGCFECINSEAILPALNAHLTPLHFVPAFAIARRFFDGKFGPNYDLTRPARPVRLRVRDGAGWRLIEEGHPAARDFLLGRTRRNDRPLIAI